MAALTGDRETARRDGVLWSVGMDKALFKDFISTLQVQDVLRRNSAGLIDFDDDIERIGEDARLVLGEEIRHSILSLTFSAPGIDRL